MPEYFQRFKGGSRVNIECNKSPNCFEDCRCANPQLQVIDGLRQLPISNRRLTQAAYSCNPPPRRRRRGSVHLSLLMYKSKRKRGKVQGSYLGLVLIESSPLHACTNPLLLLVRHDHPLDIARLLHEVILAGDPMDVCLYNPLIVVGRDIVHRFLQIFIRAGGDGVDHPLHERPRCLSLLRSQGSQRTERRNEGLEKRN